MFFFFVLLLDVSSLRLRIYVGRPRSSTSAQGCSYVIITRPNSSSLDAYIRLHTTANDFQFHCRVASSSLNGYFVGHWRIETMLPLDWQFRIEEMTRNNNRVASLVLRATRTNWTAFFFSNFGFIREEERKFLMSHEDESTSVELKWWSQVSARYCWGY